MRAQVREVVINGAKEEYWRYLRSTNPIFYIPLWDKAGAVASELMRGNNGSYAGATPPTLGQPGIGDGKTGITVPGSTSAVNIYSVGLNGLFNGQLGTALIWGVPNIAAWSDGIERRFFNIAGATAGNVIMVRKSTTIGELLFQYQAGSVNKTVLTNVFDGALDFLNILVTWDLVADQAIFYINNTPIGSPLTGIGTWAGVLSSTACAVGSSKGDGTTTVVWKGGLQHFALWDRVVSSTERTKLNSYFPVSTLAGTATYSSTIGV